jgi:hypothetical protein
MNNRNGGILYFLLGIYTLLISWHYTILFSTSSSIIYYGRCTWFMNSLRAIFLMISGERSRNPIFIKTQPVVYRICVCRDTAQQAAI